MNHKRDVATMSIGEIEEEMTKVRRVLERSDEMNPGTRRLAETRLEELESQWCRLPEQTKEGEGK